MVLFLTCVLLLLLAPARLYVNFLSLRIIPKPLPPASQTAPDARSEEHTSELQSLTNLVCRLLLEKKKQTFRSQDARKTSQKRCFTDGGDCCLVHKILKRVRRLKLYE